MQQEPVTPEEQPVQQMEAEETCVRVNDESIQAKGPVELHGDIVCTIRKSFRSREMISPYSQNPKSYRKAHKKELDSIPYRKCYDNFEARIVLILNKLHDGKNSQKDLELLVEKMQKISPKELLNRYIISGIVAIIRLASDQNIYPVHSL